MTDSQDSELFNLTRAEIESHPTGVIVLDRGGTILQYNKAEAKLARREHVETVGLNFWKDVAPCTAVQDFKGRFDDFAALQGNAVSRFDFDFRFAWGTQAVGITMIRKDGEEPITLLVTVKSVAG
ncbi:MAG TPA: PAS domain-containing protein [Candidatus Baltobacteraceae bacterium]